MGKLIKRLITVSILITYVGISGLHIAGETVKPPAGSPEISHKLHTELLDKKRN